MVALLAVSSSVMAAGHVDSVRYLTTKFGKNWFISASATGNWYQGSMRTPENLAFENSYTKVEWGKPTFGFNVSGGKWLNHCTGVRVVYNNTRIHSYIRGLQNFEHLQFLYGDTPELIEGTGDNAVYATSLRYHNLRADFMVSPIDFFQGYYNPDRIWTPVLYISGGGAFVSKDFFAIKSLIDGYKSNGENNVNAKTGYNFELALGAGLANNFRISDHFDINLDLNWTFQRWTLDSWTYEFTEAFGTRPKRFDNLYQASLGVTYFFSREYDLPKDCPEIMEKNDSIIKVIETVHDTIVKFVNTQSEDILSYPFSIFFNRDSYQLMSRRDIVNLREIAKVAKDNGYKLLLTGSCDSATATPAYNQTLSENRCNKIKVELLELGVPEDQIVIEPIGGVKILDPTEYDRRVLIQLLKEADK